MRYVVYGNDALSQAAREPLTLDAYCQAHHLLVSFSDEYGFNAESDAELKATSSL